MIRKTVQKDQKASILHDYNYNVAVAVSTMYAEEIDNELGEKGLHVARPPEFGTPIEDISRYVAIRRNNNNVDTSAQNHYEKWLHERLCPCCKGHVFPIQTILTIIEAPAGVGKTSFLRFVLNGFAQKLMLDERTDVQRQQHIKFWEDVKQIYIELTAFSGDDFYVEFYEKIKIEILRCFPNITREVTGLKWKNFIKGSPIPLALGDFIRDKNLKSAKVFVGKALWYIARTSLKDKSLIFIFDNMDQQNDEPLKRVVSDIITMVAFVQNEHLNWKLVLPLRPETWLRITYHVLDGRPGGANHTRKVLEDVDKRMATKIRAMKLEEGIKESHQIVPVFHTVGNELIYAPISSPVAAKFYNSLMQWLPDFAHDSEKTLNKFCNGSLRKELELRKRLLSSVVAGRAIKKLLCGEGTPEELNLENETSSYDCLTGIITNPMPGCCDNFIPNLYYFIRNSDDPYYTWACPYILCYLRANHALAVNGIPYGTMMNTFRNLGFREEIIKSALSYLAAYNGMIYHWTKTNTIHFVPRIIEGLLELFVEPAYTDVMATETPVDQDYLDRGMTHTSAINHSDFPARSQTSLLFLRQVIADERAIITKLKKLNLNPNEDFTKAAFFAGIKARFNEPQLHGLSSAIFLKYRDRFVQVRQLQKDFFKSKSGYGEWSNKIQPPDWFLNETEKDLNIEQTIF